MMGDGFPLARAKEALENCGGNLEAAANWIFSNPLPVLGLGRIGEAAATAAVSQNLVSPFPTSTYQNPYPALYRTVRLVTQRAS